METQELPIREVNLSESDVQRVASELQKSPESGTEASAASPEEVRRALVAALPQPMPSATPSQAAVTTVPEMAQGRVDALVRMAVEQGIDAAHAAAQDDEPYVLDALHDALAGALYEQLKAQGRL